MVILSGRICRSSHKMSLFLPVILIFVRTRAYTNSSRPLLACSVHFPRRVLFVVLGWKPTHSVLHIFMFHVPYISVFFCGVGRNVSNFEGSLSIPAAYSGALEMCFQIVSTPRARASSRIQNVVKQCRMRGIAPNTYFFSSNMRLPSSERAFLMELGTRGEIR